MRKNGTVMVSVVERDKLIPGIWDPYHYRKNHSRKQLSDFVLLKKIRGRKYDSSILDFDPIEYRHIPKGRFLIFSLHENHEPRKKKYYVVREQVLLFGTMRAYVGNVFVTPRAEWIGKESPILFPVNSEFVRIVPKDSFLYFWWAFLQSPTFLQSLPAGSGGTRPRMTPETLSKTPVSIPETDIRKEIHEKLVILAEKDWRNYSLKERLVLSI